MEDKIFPNEILDFSIEKHYISNKVKGKSLYIILLVVFFILLGLLPIIKINLTTQSRGVIKSQIKNNLIQSAVGGKIIYSNILENTKVECGDTLVIINTEKINKEIKNIKGVIQRKKSFIDDIKNLCDNKIN